MLFVVVDAEVCGLLNGERRVRHVTAGYIEKDGITVGGGEGVRISRRGVRGLEIEQT